MANSKPLPVIGWREWASLPDLGIGRIKAKIDTGARSSALHATSLVRFERDGKTWIRFKVHPLQRNTTLTVETEAELLEYRKVRSSNGQWSQRPVILTSFALGEGPWKIELTLTSRDEMGFRMLLGRQAIRDRFLVDSGGSFLTGPAPDVAKKKKRKRKKSSE